MTFVADVHDNQAMVVFIVWEEKAIFGDGNRIEIPLVDKTSSFHGLRGICTVLLGDSDTELDSLLESEFFIISSHVDWAVVVGVSGSTFTGLASNDIRVAPIFWAGSSFTIQVIGSLAIEVPWIVHNILSFLYQSVPVRNSLNDIVGDVQMFFIEAESSRAARLLVMNWIFFIIIGNNDSSDGSR